MMSSKSLVLFVLFLVGTNCFSQKSKIQSAWRNLNDYEATMTDNPDLSYLIKAKENLNIALANEETKNSSKAYAYKCRVMYNIYQYNLKDEQKKLEATITDKNARTEASYASTSVVEFEESINALNKIKELDPKYFETILEVQKGGNSPSDDDLKLSNVAVQLKLQSSNIAVGKYKSKQFEQSADYFYKAASLTHLLTGKKDTSSYYNACISAQKSKNPSKMIEYNKSMIDQKIATPYNFQTIYDAKLAINDTASALEYLKLGRTSFPNDVYLMNRETEIYLQKGNQKQALENLSSSLEKDPNNAQLQLVTGNVYDNLANPKNSRGKDTTKPANYDELILKAAEHYQKAIDLKPANQESYFNALYNLGALYNNYGATLYSKSMEKATLTDLAKNQKNYEAKSMDYYKKAIPYLEQALAIKNNDNATMTALRKLYFLTGNEAKGKEMTEKLKGK